MCGVKRKKNNSLALKVLVTRLVLSFHLKMIFLEKEEHPRKVPRAARLGAPWSQPVATSTTGPTVAATSPVEGLWPNHPGESSQGQPGAQVAVEHQVLSDHQLLFFQTLSVLESAV